jgi:hypothetical protein
MFSINNIYKLFQHILHPFSSYTPTENDVYISCLVDSSDNYSGGLVEQSSLFSQGIVNTSDVTLQSKVQL